VNHLDSWKSKASWKGVGVPRNGISKKPYRGVNILMLAMEQYDSPLWLTYKQAKELGGSVFTGEKGTPVIFWKWIEKSDEETKEIKKYPS
jgi:antirestriction protein ArdC